MKTFYDLTNEEKVLLTEEQVQYYAKLDCANRGIVIPQKPINKLKEVIPPTQKYYMVGYESFIYETEKEAQDYIDAKAKSFQIRGIGNNYDNKNQYVDGRSAEYKDIKSVILYTKEEANDLKSILEYNSTTQKEWDEYSKSLKEYDSIVYDMWDEISAIKFEDSRKDFYNKVYADYLELANNDDSIAFTFFEKAYKNISLSEVDREIVDDMLKREVCDNAAN
jgi:hypothetical protein